MKRSLFIWTLFGSLFIPLLGRGAEVNNNEFQIPENSLAEKPKTKEKRKKSKKKKKKGKKGKKKKEKNQQK